MVLPVTLVSWPSQVRGLLKAKAPFLVKRELQQVAFKHKLTLVNPDIVPIIPAEKHWSIVTMAIIRQRRSGTQNKAETGLEKENGQTKSKIVLASKLRRIPLLARGRRNAKERERAGQRDLGKERNLRKERKQRNAPRSQMMYWLKQRNDNAEDRQFFLPPRQRYIIAKIDKVQLVFKLSKVLLSYIM